MAVLSKNVQELTSVIKTFITQNSVAGVVGQREAAQGLLDVRTQMDIQRMFGIGRDRTQAAAAQSLLAQVQGQSALWTPPSAQTSDPYVQSSPEVRQRHKKNVEDASLRAAQASRVQQEDDHGVYDTQSKIDFPTNWSAGRHGGAANLRGQVSARVAQYINNKVGSYPVYDQVLVPEDRNVQVGHKLGRVRQLKAGEAAKRVFLDPETQKVVEESTAKAAMKTANRAAAISRGVAEFGESGSLLGGVQAALPQLGKVAGAAGMVYTVGQQAYKQVLAQTEANRPYEQVLGTSGGATNWSAYRERLNKNLFRIGNNLSLNPLGGAANEIYERSLQMYAGDSSGRRESMQTAADLVRSTGMDTGQIYKAFEIAQKQGMDGLAQIGNAFKDVTKAAKEAGMNAEEARDRFNATYADISKSMNGVGAVQVAQAQTSTLTSLGPQFTDVAIDNGLTSDVMTANAMGIGLVEYQSMKKDTKGGSVKIDAAKSKLRRDSAMSLGGSAFARTMNELGLDSNQELSPSDRKKVAASLQNNMGMTDEALASWMNSIGGFSGVTPANAYEMYINSISGATDTSEETNKIRGELTPQSINESDVKSKFKDDIGLSEQDARFVKAAVYDDDEISRQNIEKRKGKRVDALRYAEVLNETGETNPLAEKLLKNYDASRRYRVQTKDGTKIVNTGELMEHFSDQLMRNDVEIVKGQDKGQTVAEAFGVDPENFTTWGETASSSQEKSPVKGGKDDGKAMTGTITIKPDERLARLLAIEATGGSGIRVEGVPSSGRNTTADSRPTGG